MKTFLIGGARSGKSSLAARWAAERSQKVCCVVTATVSDDEMAARIGAHQRERPAHWRVREAPLRLDAAVKEEGRSGDLLLVDCLTLWTANCLWPPVPTPSSSPPLDFQPDLAGWHAQRDAFLEPLRASRPPPPPPPPPPPRRRPRAAAPAPANLLVTA